ncbi:MAG: adenylate/guanylate cyclase domain-containing protein [Chloroflexota bacterium]|nr:adenylate/guanylate cyclase domain-containing protein [Chloroflexota bacterium]
MPLPTGTVTFLFTDVEGSTREWDTRTELMSRALERHDAVLRKAIAEHGGHIFATGGDGVSAAFATADAAAGAAVAAQGALAEEDWADRPALRVRMGIHTGVAEERGGDNFGPAVNRCARLMAIGHGGQILCSRAAADLLGPLPAGIALVDHGEHRLKDLSRAEHVMEIRLPGAGPFDDLKSLDARRHNLPVYPTSFVGREPDIIAVSKMLDLHRLVVLTGVGGSGKTRLALEVAARESQRYPDGMYFVDLAALSDPSHLAMTVAAAMAITVASPAEAHEQLLTSLDLDRCSSSSTTASTSSTSARS